MSKLLIMFVLFTMSSLAFSQHVMKSPSELMWGPGPEGLPPGAEAAVLSGDPKKEGLFTIRLKFPANYKIMPHWHPTDEHITVIEGDFNMGLGDMVDETKSHPMPVGGYAVMPAKSRHYAFTKDSPAIVQVHGKGPFKINYVDPKDDPRKKK